MGLSGFAACGGNAWSCRVGTPDTSSHGSRVLARSLVLFHDGLDCAHEGSLVPLLDLAAGKGWLLEQLQLLGHASLKHCSGVISLSKSIVNWEVSC